MQSSQKKIWRFKQKDDQQCRRLADELGIPVAIATLLCQRGINDVRLAKNFLEPSLSHLPSPKLMKGMQTAVGIITRAIEEGRPVGLFGDYDVDGITGSAILALFLQELGLKVASYQPNRLTDGYGLNNTGLEKLSDSCHAGDHEKKGGVLITVDCGINNAKEIERARELGFSVIVTDHHKVPARLPEADAILNPLQPGCGFPFKQLAGVGVAFYLCMGIRQRLAADGFWPPGMAPNLKQYLDLVAIGTVADLVPLLDVNRILVRGGLEVASMRSRPGLQCLLDVAGVRNGFTPEDIAFRIAPRLNAAGRMGSPEKAVELLITDNIDRGRQLAADLDEANQSRKLKELQVFKEACEMAEKRLADDKKSLVLAGMWHAGIIGIVASRLVERFWRPVILLAIDEAPGSISPAAKGSGRTIPGLNLYELISDCKDLLEQYGGHDAAAGLTIRKDKIELFQERFERAVRDKTEDEKLIPQLWIDCRVDLEDIFSPAFIESYNKLEPFGQENPEPLFHCGRLRLDTTRVVGGDHLKFSISQHGQQRNGIGFGLGSLADRLKGFEHELAVNLRANKFRGAIHYEINLVDVRDGSPENEFPLAKA